MKISKLFHWLYAAVMMLPLFLFPIFALAVRSDNNYQTIEVQQEKVVVANFNQLALFNNPSGTIGDITWSSEDYVLTLEGTADSNYYIPIVQGGASGIVQGHIYYLHGNLQETTNFGYMYYNDNNIQRVDYGNGVIFTADMSADAKNITVYVRANDNVTGFSYSPMLHDLTLMFGDFATSVTIESFNSWFSDSYYPYDTGTNVLVHTGIYETFNDTDVGSQMVYTTYKVMDNYFNYDKVFNFSSLYDWLQFTYFNGTAPMGFFIFWHLLIYWMLTSLIWLLFDVLMYVPLLIHRWLDKAALS